MSKKNRFVKAYGLLIAAVLGIMSVPAVSVSGVSEEMTDSGLDYSESTETINNPGAGYTSSVWYTCKPGDTPVKNPTGNLVILFINIGAFSSGANGTTDDYGNYTEGTDYDLDETFFAGLRGTLENCRKNGCTVAMRFRYDENGKTNPEPATFEQVLKHISQIKENGVLEDYRELIMYIETGFTGAWGEQHSGKYTSVEYKAQLLDAMLDMVPPEIPVTVRTPDTFAKWAGIERSEINTWVSEPGSEAARVGMYNDGYMGSDSDLGTFSDRAKETEWLGNQTLYTYYGGEFSGNLEWAQKFDTYLPENAVPEMYKTHLSYINSNIYSLYKDYTYGEPYDTGGADNSAYYGETVYKFIRDHIGYRFVLRDSDLSSEVKQGGILKLDFDVENTGFANPVRQQTAELLLEKDGDYYTVPVDIDTRKWLSCETSVEQLEMKLPGGMETGEWNVYIRFSKGNSGVEDSYMRTVRFANNGLWNASLGANLLGSFEVTENANIRQITRNSLAQMNTEETFYASLGNMNTINNIIINDGTRSSEAEWNDSLLAASEGDNRLYVTNDDKYLYVMAEIAQNAAAPVYNLQIKNASEDNKFYWIYYASNGYVYFNNGSYDGCTCNRSGNYVEFRIPFGRVMNIEPGTVLSSVRVSIQDSADSWVVTGELTSGEYTVEDSFAVYTAKKTVSAVSGKNISMGVETSLENAEYQWYHDGKIISGANDKSYFAEAVSPEDEGLYTVKITSSGGVVREAEICQIEKVYVTAGTGDINGDGAVNIADAVTLQSYLLRRLERRDIFDDLSDITGDESTDIFDMIALRTYLTSKEKA